MTKKSPKLPGGWAGSKIVPRNVDDLLLNARNSKKHPRDQIDHLKGLIRSFGWTMPVLVDESGTLLAGEGRVLAAKELEIEAVPTIEARGWSEDQKRAYVIADNRVAEGGKWDRDRLKTELVELEKSGVSLELTGFSLDDVGEHDRLGSTGSNKPKEEDGLERLRNKVLALIDPVETAGNRALAVDGDVGDDLLLVAQDPDLRKEFDKAYQELRAEVESREAV